MQKSANIKNIIFDLGNVLIPLKTDNAREAFQKLMPSSQAVPDIFSFKNLDNFTDFETGRISAHVFFESLKPRFREDVTINEIISAWNKILGNFPAEHTEMLKKLAAKYRLFVLSNTNEIHAAKYEKEVPGVDHLKDLFEKLYYSHLEGLRKPQPELYERVLKQNQLNPGETLFADDLPENIETARNLGIQTLHVTPDMNLPEWFSQLYS